MDIQAITEEIRNKLTHVANIRSRAYVKTLEHLDEESKEAEMSTFITEITFEVSEKIVKEKLARINPKPMEFSFYINREKYFEQTIKELIGQLSEDIELDAEAMEKQKDLMKNKDHFVINFSGYFLRDYGYIGKKKSMQIKEICENWMPAVFACLKLKGDSEGEIQTIEYLKKFIMFGFERALALEYVFMDNQKFENSMLAIDFVQLKDSKMNAEEFDQYRKKNAFGRKI